jgi:hypothetical protein
MAFTSLLKYAKTSARPPSTRSVRRALEFRDPSWLFPEVFAILQRYQVALCINELIKNHPRFLPRLGHHYAGSLFAPESWPRQPMLRQKLFRLAALTLQCAGLTTLESSSTSEPGRNTVLQASNGRWGSYRMAASYFNISARRGRSRLTF